MTKTTETEDARERLRKLKEFKVYRLRNEKYRYYEPNGVAEEFINAVSSGDHFIVFLSAANGVGKTATATNILAHLMWPIPDNRYFTGKLFKDWPFPKKGRIITDSALVEKNVVSELKFWFPKDRYDANKGGKHFESQWSTDTGWEFDIMTYDQDPTQFEGATLGWAWFDEPPPDAILKATIARMRRGGVIFITATPISGSAHLFDLFASGELEVSLQLREGEEPIKVKRKIKHITSDVEAACKTHGIRGHLDHEHIVQMVAEYPEDERQARVYGKFQHLVGLVFKRFSRNIHVIKPFPITMRDFVVLEFMDPHPRNPDAVMWLAIDRKGTKYIVDELYFKPQDTPELAARVKNRARDYRIVYRGIDPSAFNTNQHDGMEEKSLGDKLAGLGLVYLAASKTRSMSDKRIETALNYTEINGKMIRSPELYIFDTCQRTIFEMEHYRWAEWTGKAADQHDRKEKPVDKDDHMIECLGRALSLEFGFIEMPKPADVHHIGREDFDPYA